MSTGFKWISLAWDVLKESRAFIPLFLALVGYSGFSLYEQAVRAPEYVTKEVVVEKVVEIPVEVELIKEVEVIREVLIDKECGAAVQNHEQLYHGE